MTDDGCCSRLLDSSALSVCHKTLGPPQGWSIPNHVHLAPPALPSVHNIHGTFTLRLRAFTSLCACGCSNPASLTLSTLHPRPPPSTNPRDDRPSGGHRDRGAERRHAGRTTETPGLRRRPANCRQISRSGGHRILNPAAAATGDQRPRRLTAITPAPVAPTPVNGLRRGGRPRYGGFRQHRSSAAGRR